MLNFPVPYSEELLYSTVARAGIRHGIVSPKQLLDEVFASRDVIATLDLPNHISAISRWLPEEFTAERLIYNHTLFPVYAPFVPEKRRQQCIKWMLGKSQGAVHLALGIAASRLKTPGFIRFCPSCLAKQRTLHGEFFWLREWQVPGIDACPKHGALVDTRIIRPFVERHRFIAASPEHCPMVKTPKKDVFSKRTSRQVRDLLKFPAQRSPSFWQWSAYYHDLARQHGYRRGKCQIDHHSIREKVLLEWSSPWLVKYDLMPNISGNDSDWLQSIFRKHRKSFSYLQHIIIHQALLGNNWKIQNIIKEVSHYPTEERQRNKQITPVKKQKLTPDQKSWLSLLSSSCSPKYARNQVPALYGRLYRKHRDWLVAANQRFADNRKGSRKQRVD